MSVILANSNPNAHLPIDQSVSLPAAVRAAAAAADALMAPPNPAPAAPAAPVTVQPQEVPRPTNPTPEPIVIPPVVSAPPVAPQTPQPTDWERVAKTWQGRYEASEKRHNEAIMNLTQEIGQLRAQKTAPSPPQVAAAPTVFTPDPKYVELFGEDMASAIYEIAGGIAATQVAGVAQRLTQTAEEELQARQLRLFADMDAKVPTWRSVNEDARFFSWLALRDTFSGVIRSKLLADAFEKGDTDRVQSFFNSFISEAGPSPAIGETQSGTPAEPAAQPPSNRLDLAELAAPGQPRPAAAPGAPVEKRVWTRSEITRFYSEKSKATLRPMTPAQQAEWDALEKDVFAAQTEGRVKN